MLGYIIKFCFLVIVVMVTLNIFAPEQADKVLSTFSKSTDIEETMLKENLDNVTKFTQDTLSEVTEKVKKNLGQ